MAIDNRRIGLSRIGTGMLLVLLAVIPTLSAQAVAPDISIALDQPTTIIGRTVTLSIQIVNLEPHTIVPTRFECITDGTSLSAALVVQLPPAIAPNGSFSTQQSYTAVAAGTTQIHCELAAVDAETGEHISEVSPTEAGQVLSETRLTFEGAVSSSSVQVGDTLTITTRYANRGEVAFEAVSVSCAEAGRSLASVSHTSAQTTLQPSDVGSTESTWRAVESGTVPIFCSLIATDSQTGEQVVIPGTPLTIEVQ